jgi:hypothetical protein
VSGGGEGLACRVGVSRMMGRGGGQAAGALSWKGPG